VTKHGELQAILEARKFVKDSFKKMQVAKSKSKNRPEEDRAEGCLILVAKKPWKAAD
jgi:hypothetical protein